MKNNFKTSDFYTACALRFLGHKIIGRESIDSRKFLFVFDVYEDKGEKIKSDFLNGNIKGDLKLFCDKIDEMKNRIYQ